MEYENMSIEELLAVIADRDVRIAALESDKITLEDQLESTEDGMCEQSDEAIVARERLSCLVIAVADVQIAREQGNLTQTVKALKALDKETEKAKIFLSEKR